MGRDVFSVDASLSTETECARPSPKQADGAVCARWVRCGKAWCRCMQGGPKHGPYYARYWWQDGRRYKRYVRQDDADTVMAACADRRAAADDERARNEATCQAWRNVRALIREIEHGEY